MEFTEDLSVKEVRGKTMVARGWCLGMTSWDDSDAELEEWLPSTTAAQEEYAEHCRKRDARILAYEVWNFWLTCMSLCMQSARSPFTVAVFHFMLPVTHVFEVIFLVLTCSSCTPASQTHCL